MISVGIVGGTGYTGVELLRLLGTHPDCELRVITSRSESGKPVADLFPNLRGLTDLTYVEPDSTVLSECDLIFFATPNGVAMTQVPELLESGTRIIDLAADFRIGDADIWGKWYGMTHACPDLLCEAVYGLPELNREAIKTARLVANPGCYPTAVSLGFLPLLKHGLIDTGYLIADAKSGVSGAGRSANVGMLMGEMGESFKAYAIPGHRHQPEIRQTLGRIAASDVGLTFVPHLVPMIRGIEATLYARLTQEVDDLQSLFETQYRDEPFVDVMSPGSHPETRSVRGANHCRIAVHRPLDGEVVVVSSVIDNLVKGAAGQAVQNMNLMFGFAETSGLNQVALLP
ncbi:MAG: N-acetyl-gamma-glutamyl-phosphate reductase [Candidatus Thiodiazotropha sp.]